MSGQVIGRYALYSEIASGGMASVHIARLMGPAGFSRTVAIKRLHPQFAKDPEFVAMLLDEARLAARVRHPNVVSTLDVVAEGPEALLVMEYVAGPSLAKVQRLLVERREAIPVPVALAIALGVLDGLQAAHEATSDDGRPLSLVHRDVSPQNVLLSPEGVALVTDFGIAKAAGRLQGTHEGQVKGKTGYMSPEQIRGQPVDRRTDVFAAAVVLWEMLVGHRLFRAESAIATMSLTLEMPIPRPRSIRADVPEELDAAVMQGLSRDPAVRPETAAALASMLATAGRVAPSREVATWLQGAAGELIRERARLVQQVEVESSEREVQLLKTTPDSPASFAAPVPPGSGSSPQLTTEPVRFESRYKRWAWGAAGVLAVALLGYFLRPKPGPAPTEAAPRIEATVSAASPEPRALLPVAQPTERPTSAALPGDAGTPVVAAKPKPKPKPPPSKPPPTKPNPCNPPYTTDAAGVRRWKDGC